MKSVIILTIALFFGFQSGKPTVKSQSICSLKFEVLNSDSIKVEFTLDTGTVGLTTIQCGLGHIDRDTCDFKVLNFGYRYNYLDSNGHKKLEGDAKIIVTGNVYSFTTKKTFKGEMNYLRVEATDGRGNYSNPVYYKNSKSLAKKYCKDK